MLDRKVAPPFVKSSSFNLIKPEEKQLPNGCHLFFVAGGSQDVLKIELIFGCGRWFEQQLGAAYFMAHMFSKGTNEKTSFEIAELFDRYGAHLEISPGLDFVSVSLYTLTKNLRPVLQLLLEILRVPTFPDHEFRQTQSVFIQNLKVNNEKTSFVASKLFRKNLFGENHPYGCEVEEKDVNALQPLHLRTHFDRFIHSPVIFVSGKIQGADRTQMLDAFGQLQEGKNVDSPHYAVEAQPKHEHVKKKEAVQSSVRIGKRSLVRAHPDYVPVLFVSHILGGYFGSRLMKNIREEKGLTYGISASIHGLKHDSYLVIGADVNKENVSVTFDEIRKELKKLRTTYLPFTELETTRNHFIGSLQSELATPFAHAEKLKTIALFDLRRDHYQQLINRIEKITPADIAAISEQYFQESEFYGIAVG